MRPRCPTPTPLSWPRGSSPPRGARTEERQPVQRLGHDELEAMRLGLALVYRGHNLVRQRPESIVSSGLRLWDKGTIQSEFVSLRECPGCRRTCVLRASAELEDERGLASIMRLWYVRCRRQTDQLATSRALPSEGKGRALMEVNARAYLGACQAGLGLAAVRRFLGALDLHVPSKACWNRMGKEVKAAMIDVGTASERQALLLERRLACGERWRARLLRARWLGSLDHGSTQSEREWLSVPGKSRISPR